jgi:hypothetical protein
MVVFTRIGKVRRHVVVGGISLAVVIGDAWLSSLLLVGRGGVLTDLGVVAAIVIGALALWLVIGHAKRISTWLRWRSRPLPAIRLTTSGLDYSPAYTGDFPFHVDWGIPLESAFRQGVDNTGFFWCLYSPIVHGIDPLPAFIHRQWPLKADQVRAELRQMIQQLAIDENSPEQMAAARHLVSYGTPIAINPLLLVGTAGLRRRRVPARAHQRPMHLLPATASRPADHTAVVTVPRDEA